MAQLKCCTLDVEPHQTSVCVCVFVDHRSCVIFHRRFDSTFECWITIKNHIYFVESLGRCTRNVRIPKIFHWIGFILRFLVIALVWSKSKNVFVLQRQKREQRQQQNHVVDSAIVSTFLLSYTSMCGIYCGIHKRCEEYFEKTLNRSIRQWERNHKCMQS